MLRQAVDGVVRNAHEAGERGGDDDRAPARHHAVETADAVHDAVHVHADGAAVLIVRQRRDVLAPREDARVQAGEVDRADVLPGCRVADVEARDEVELLHLEPLGPQLGDDRRADASGRAGYECRHGVSTTFPVDCRVSTSRCASAACSSGNSAPTTGRTAPPSHSLEDVLRAALDQLGIASDEPAQVEAVDPDVAADEPRRADVLPHAAGVADRDRGSHRFQELE